jgi:hypothetical protein
MPPLTCFVYGPVGQAIRLDILLARDMMDDEPAKMPDALFCHSIQIPEDRVLDLVAPLHLSHNELRVRVHLDVRTPQRLRPFQSKQEGAVFRHIVGRLADRATHPFRHLAVRPEDEHADASRPRIPAGSAVYVNPNAAAIPRRFSLGGGSLVQGPEGQADDLNGLGSRDPDWKVQHAIAWGGLAQPAKPGHKLCYIHVAIQRNR